MRKNVVFGLVVAITICALSACSWSVASTKYTYSDADRYTTGDRDIAEPIDTIQLDYVAGDITIVQERADVVSVREISRKALDTNMQVHTWVDGSTLHVRYCASGERINTDDLDKSLTIGIPDDVELSELDIDCAAGNVDVTAKRIDSLQIDLAAGNCTLSLASEPSDARIEAAAGDVTVELPKDCDLTLNIDSALGTFESNIPFTKDGDTYMMGSGKNHMAIDVAAGNVTVNGSAQ